MEQRFPYLVSFQAKYLSKYYLKPKLFSVKKVSMFSPAAKAGLCVGDTLVTINDWNIEAMDNIQVCVTKHYHLYLYFDHIYHTIDWL